MKSESKAALMELVASEGRQTGPRDQHNNERITQGTYIPETKLPTLLIWHHVMPTTCLRGRYCHHLCSVDDMTQTYPDRFGNLPIVGGE